MNHWRMSPCPALLADIITTTQSRTPLSTSRRRNWLDAAPAWLDESRARHVEPQLVVGQHRGGTGQGIQIALRRHGGAAHVGAEGEVVVALR